MGRALGACTRIRQRQPTARDRAWQSMRILRTFSLNDLIATAGIKLDNAKYYIRGLTRSGYIVIARPRAKGYKGGHVIYRLIKDTGPRAPRLQSDGNTYDPNTQQVHPGGILQRGDSSSE